MFENVLSFWFEEITEASWWVKDEAFDMLIKERFGELHRRATACELFGWRASAEGSLAEIIVLDQFSRNIYRDTPAAFTSDPLALSLAQRTIEKGFDQQLPVRQRNFLYLPYMHSESLIIHEQAVELYAAQGDQKTIDFEHKHKVIIEQFGRYPHRNSVLGRPSTPEEIEFLKHPGSGF